MNKQYLENYATLIIEMGVQIRPGQKLLITADVRDHEFVEMLVDKAFRKGAADVSVDFSDQVVTRTYFDFIDDEKLTQIDEWQIVKMQSQAMDNTAFLTVRRTPYKVFAGLDTSRVLKRTHALIEKAPLRREYLMKSLRSWCLVSMPTQEWAEVVFPELPVAQAYERLWEEVFKIMRADRPNPVEAWKAHAQKLKSKCSLLNDLRLKSLHFKSSTSDLEVELIENHHWQGGEKNNAFGQSFIANMPTEEVHTMPKRNGVNGWIKNTRPLLIDGQKVDDFRLVFKDGQLVESQVGLGKELLEQRLNIDEGARFLGEVALVPHASPISQTGIIFHDTLYDENASCHLALGEAYPASLIGGKDMDREQLKALGVNQSRIHMDFMVGSADLSITAVRADGSTLQIFKDGEWAI